jgi:hypothetical protein
MNIKFENLVGKTGILCAVDSNKFRIGNVTFEVLEDPDDGYRSSMEEVKVCTDQLRPTFEEKVTICNYEHSYITGFSLVNENQDAVLIFGTDHVDNYYPCFVFDWNPQLLTFNIDIDSLLNTID